jgi:hypothetical protein
MSDYRGMTTFERLCAANLFKELSGKAALPAGISCQLEGFAMTRFKVARPAIISLHKIIKPKLTNSHCGV